LANRKSKESDDWGGNIISFLAGQLPESEFLAVVTNGDNGVGGVHQCEAYFFAGAKLQLDGDAQGARNYFEKCVGTGCKTSAASQWATAQLKKG
jgi:lipoprotein NlpI